MVGVTAASEIRDSTTRRLLVGLIALVAFERIVYGPVIGLPLDVTDNNLLSTTLSLLANSETLMTPSDRVDS